MGTDDERASTAGDPATASAAPAAHPPTVEETWRGAWPAALAAWSSYTLLRDPTFFFSGKEAAPEGMAGEIAANPPLVVQGVKRVMNECAGKSVEEGLRYVAVWNAAFLQSQDLGEALAAFMERRPPHFKGE